VRDERPVVRTRVAATPAPLRPAPPDDPAERELLRRCRRFRSPEEHADVVCRALGADPSLAPSVCAVVERLVGEGHLISELEVMRRVVAHATREEGSGGIETVGFVTRGRPHTLARGVLSYDGHAARNGRSIRTVVMDDGSGRDVPAALGEVSDRLHGPLFYAGEEQKRAYARRLSEHSGAPEDVVAFAMLDPFETGATYGANRNALFLETAGEMVLSADDDTLLRAFVPPGVSPGLSVSGGRPPIDYWFFEDLDTGMEQIAESGEDVLAALETMVGRSVAALFAEAGERVNLTRVGEERLGRLLADPGKVVAVMPGMLGDVGGESPLYHLLSARGSSHHAMVATVDSYRTAVTRRDQLHAVRTNALSQGGFLLTTAVAFDARDVLPPFFPVFRCEDNLYGDVLRWCRPHDWIGHVPTALVHSPEGQRKYDVAAVAKPGFLLGLSAIFALLMEDAPLEGADCGVRQRAMGRHLEAMARDVALDETIRDKVISSVRERIRYVRQCREAYADSPAWWHRDLEHHAAALESIPESAPIVPRETGSLKDIRTLLAAFGELLQWWPDLWRAAVEMRSAGETLAKPLRS
jgi:hypothetical protein